MYGIAIPKRKEPSSPCVRERSVPQWTGGTATPDTLLPGNCQVCTHESTQTPRAAQMRAHPDARLAEPKPAAAVMGESRGATRVRASSTTVNAPRPHHLGGGLNRVSIRSRTVQSTGAWPSQDTATNVAPQPPARREAAARCGDGGRAGRYAVISRLVRYMISTPAVMPPMVAGSSV